MHNVINLFLILSVPFFFVLLMLREYWKYKEYRKYIKDKYGYQKDDHINIGNPDFWQ